MARFEIKPKDTADVIEAKNAGEAMERFAMSMDMDMNRYFKAVPEGDFKPSKGISEADMPEFVGQIIDIFEDFLEEKGISIENDERVGDEGEAIIFGSDYGMLQDSIEDTVKAWGLKEGE